MTRAYHDVEAVSRLLQEKEKDLELAAKIGQELLERNRRLEDRVGGLEAQINSSTELITQLRHELAVKTDLLHVYTNDAIEEASPVELRNVNVDLMQRKVKDLEDENKRLHQEATELAKEAYDCEEKEEKLVSDAVKHLTEANVQINYLSEEFIVKSDESRRQKEEITHLLAQVCDVQSKLKRSNGENEELSAQLRIYKETQDELTAELADFKEKYREIVDLLHDTQEELKSSRKRTYPGAGQHDVSGMFACNPSSKDTAKKGTDDISLQSEIHSSLRSSKRTSKRSSHQSSKLDSASDFSDSDLDFSSSSFRHHKSSSLFKNAFSTYKLATANKMPHGGGSSTSPVPITQGYNPGQGSSLDNSYLTTSIPYMPDDNIYSYTVSRDMSRSPTHFSDIDNHESLLVGGDFDTRPSDTLTVASGGSKCLTVPYLGEQPKRSKAAEEDSVVLKVQTVGELRAPMQSAAGDSLALALPLGSVPGTNMMQREQLGSIPSLGAVPGLVPGGHEEEEQYELTSLTMEPTTTTLLEVPISDSGVTSGDFSEIGGLGDRNVADGMEATMGFTRDWIESSSSDLEQVLQKITPAEVERRRRKLHNYSSFDLGSDGFDSPGSLLGKPGFHFLPYGVRTPDSIMSTGSRDWTSSSAYGAGWKLPDKLRIVKPLEGSLTLHNWQRLAMPSLGGILEERRGVAVKGSFAHQQYLENRDKNDDDADNFMMDMLSDLEEDNNEDQEDVALRLKSGATRLQQTLTDSHILHPEVVSDTTNSYNRPQMSTTSLCSSRASSRRHSVSHGTSTFSTNLGLARVLNERNIYGGSTLSIDQISLHSGVASISSLTPSVMNSPDKLRSFTPTGTPLNSPAQSPPGTPPNEPSRRTSSVEESGLVLGFFASLRSALYGEQQKEVKTLMRKKRHHHKKCGSGSKKLGILERVEEVGVERFMSPAPVGLSDYSSDTDFFDGDDHDELVDIQPGSLTLGSASKRPNYLKNKQPSSTSSSSVVSGRGPGRVVSPGDKRPALPGGYGVPGQPGTGALEKSPCVNVRTDLGFVPSTSHHLERHRGQEQGSFIGNIATMFFGRKGGLF